jgi:hypothetical protein
MSAAGTPPTTPAKAKKTGGGDEDQSEASSKSRKALVEHPDFEFNPASLVGSWFHRLENDEMVWQGVVVGEPQAGTYLVQIDRMGPGAANVQKLITMAMLTNDDDGYGWHFYDTEAQAREAYAAWVLSSAAS